MKLYEGTAIEVSAFAFLLNCSIYPAIYAGFFVWGGPTMLGSDFRWSERNFSIGQGHKILSNFSKICIKINNNLKNYWENSGKRQSLAKFFNFRAALWEK